MLWDVIGLSVVNSRKLRNVLFEAYKAVFMHTKTFYIPASCPKVVGPHLNYSSVKSTTYPSLADWDDSFRSRPLPATPPTGWMKPPNPVLPVCTHTIVHAQPCSKTKHLACLHHSNGKVLVSLYEQ